MTDRRRYGPNGASGFWHQCLEHRVVHKAVHACTDESYYMTLTHPCHERFCTAIRDMWARGAKLREEQSARIAAEQGKRP